VDVILSAGVENLGLITEKRLTNATAPPPPTGN
jgi:hypothetical protein